MRELHYQKSETWDLDICLTLKRSVTDRGDHQWTLIITVDTGMPGQAVINPDALLKNLEKVLKQTAERSYGE